MDSKFEVPFFLAASPQLNDPHFQSSVILLIEYDEQGALGFIINNISDMKLKDVVVFNQMDIPNDIPVWFAGPVDSGAGFVLHNRDTEFYERKITEGISLSSSQESLVNLVENAHNFNEIELNSLYPFRLLVGYSGWGPRQLEKEIKEGSWIPAPLSQEILYNVPNDEIWVRTLQSIGINQHANFSTQPNNNLWIH